MTYEAETVPYKAAVEDSSVGKTKVYHITRQHTLVYVTVAEQQTRGHSTQEAVSSTYSNKRINKTKKQKQKKDKIKTHP